MAGGRSVSFEVYYLQYGRWQIHHRYGDRERDESIEEAKRLDTQGHFDASCVMRESYEHASGTSTESIIYFSPKLKNKPQIDAITGSSGGGGSNAGASSKGGGTPAASGDGGRRSNANSITAAASAAPGGGKAKAASPQREGYTFSQAVPKLLIGLLFACVAGTIVAVVGYYGIRTMAASGFNMGQQINQVLLIAAWLGGWGAVFIPILHSILASLKIGSAQASAKKKENTGPHTTTWHQAPVDASKALDEASAALQEKEAKSAPEVFPAMAEEDDDTPFEEFEPSEPDFPDDDDFEEEEEKVPEISGADQLREALQGLVAESISLSNDTLEKDHFLRFGVILFLAGAAETLARRFKVVAKEVTTILKEQIEAMGVPGNMALGFAANIDEYLLDKRYFEMYSAGRGGVLGKVDNPRADSGLTDAFKFWRSPKAASEKSPGSAQPGGGAEDEPAQGFVAVLFTDIVNSTKKQQEMGDEWLMNVVRAHNDIVREALNKHSGREIKHTGDGIMASFPAVNGSVEAALLMQEGVNKFSEMMPDLAFEICVGISAGEPIHESGDLFGTPVNLAARVLSKATARQTAVSSIVREMCRGKNFSFEILGEFDLKGFDGPQPIYLAIDQRKR